MPTVLITGCSSGIGKLTSLTFARRGDDVYATMRNLDRAHGLRQAVDEEGVKLEILQLDVTDPGSVIRAVDHVTSTAGAIDIAVNNAGIFLKSPIEEASDDEVLAQFDTNVFGLLRVIRAVLPGMRNRGTGVIVNVSSVAGLVGRPFGGLYAATKHAVEAVSETLHFEVRPLGVRIAVVEPGSFATELFDKALVARSFDERSAYWPEYQRLEAAFTRLGGGTADPRAVADTIVRVATDENAPLRTVIGSDAESILTARSSTDFEGFEHLIRSWLGWDTKQPSALPGRRSASRRASRSASRRPLVACWPVFDGEGLVGGRAGVDGPPGAAVDGPVPGEVFDGLVDAVGDDVDGAALPGAAHGHVGELPSAAVLEAVGDVHR